MITSRQNSIVKQFRKPVNAFVVEGEKLINEAICAGFEPLHILYTERFEGAFAAKLTECFVISSDLSEYISDTKSPQGVFAMFAYKSDSSDFAEARRVMLLDNVQDPGNVGAIIRSCEAFGFDGIVLSDNCADVFNSKVIRASAGSVFRLPSVRGKLADKTAELITGGFTVYGAALDESAVPLRGCTPAEKAAVVIGNEGKGISEEISALCNYRLYIPIKGAESLNASVAAGIICYELGAEGL
jgi:TrmH family RNA methyltransferase